ncbi:putative multidrug efflux protein, resistance-nodulation-cell division (RND) superfamily [Corynebacterium glutamicum MB001]|uniref:Predicted drug exporters of the RND superfamily n=2 Tax=Corynebacterium glutamicum TaxID=1718 RepID=Q8NSP3_CORGL|nr:putative multidrug efflux protein, resistance-nodulation-cell division (RND) superfamily [Corynebacterium glutamicum MB001]QYO72861.1 putative multidrug efflux protein, resistance-nodulation-cell division (RND) superfamily [Corynebacterium glutamicum]BAB98018.1 Predicted drug exporters of the RND superfamily [Corynebacterium glutamicum ATCC 13032]CAF19332.1 drug exporter, RND superfamily [Corynebacterium glutamicum ATCC 13032]
MSTSITTENKKKSGPPRLMRIFLPALLILVWLVGAGVGGPYFGKVSEVSSNSQTTYLPESADATQVQEQLGDFTDSESIPAIVVMVSDEPLTQQDITQLNEVVAGLSELDIVSDEVSPAIPSEDGRAVQVFVPLNPSAELTESVEKLSETLTQQTPDYVSTYVTGPAGFTADLSAAFAGIDGLLLAVALAAVLVILVIVYRSFILPIAVLATSLFALTVALLVVWWLAKWDILLLSGQTQGILFILVIGAATDYSLLYVARFREELRVQQDKGIATGKAIRASVEPILASGSTVIAGLLCLLFSDLKSNSTLGPVASVGIIFAMLSALTLLPALLFVFGRVAFWPKRPKYEPEKARAKNDIPASGIWSKVADLVEQHPRAIWVSTLIVLLLGAAFVPTLKADGVSQSDLVLGSSEARDGQQALGEHFPGGSGSPAYIIVDETQAAQAADVVLNNDNFETVTVTSADSPSGSAPITADGIVPLGSGTAPGPVVVEGQVLLQATLVEAPDSEEAQKAIRSIRQTFADENISAVVGGVTATSVDTNDASIHDRNLIIPIVLLVILVILMLLLRSIVAPLLLVVTTVVSFATALGVAALLFNHVFSFPGADPAVPLYGFVFLVALGIDYNIFLVTRIREETKTHGTRLGILRGLTVTGGVITSAGVVLAATFAALYVIPILFLAQIAFIVAFGVLIDTLLVRAFLVPALFYDIGPKIWWPSKLSNQKYQKQPQL